MNDPHNSPQNTSNLPQDSSAAIVLGILFGALFVIFLLVFGMFRHSNDQIQSPYVSIVTASTT